MMSMMSKSMMSAVKKVFALLLIVLFLFCGCTVKGGQGGAGRAGLGKDSAEQAGLRKNGSEQAGLGPDARSVTVNAAAHTLAERFATPAGYERIPAPEHSFAEYLRNLLLKPDGTKVTHYDGAAQKRDVHEAVVDLDIGDRDLQQCADAVIRLRAEYLFREKKYEEIKFKFTNGFDAEYAKWRDGYRIAVQDNKVNWVKTAAYSAEYRDFRKYLDMVFAYAGTLSLAKELEPVPLGEMQIGDVFIQGGSPGHCVIIVDLAENPKTGETLFILAQSYMPAQDIHILQNPADKRMSPWYSGTYGKTLRTPEWSFTQDDLKRWR
jgi:hypothetical protein